MAYCHQCEGGDEPCKRHKIVNLIEMLNSRGLIRFGEIVKEGTGSDLVGKIKTFKPPESIKIDDVNDAFDEIVESID